MSDKKSGPATIWFIIIPVAIVVLYWHESNKSAEEKAKRDSVTRVMTDTGNFLASTKGDDEHLHDRLITAISGLRSENMEKCPPEFQEAYRQFVDATQNTADRMDTYNKSSVFSGKAVSDALDAANSQLSNARSQLMTAAKSITGIEYQTVKY